MSEDPILYRIMDFFELIQTVKEQKLRVSSVDGFLDQNELVGTLLSEIENPAYGTLSPHVIDSQKEFHALRRQSHFCSSWTLARDSIAMWELYSIDHTGVQISVRISKIKNLFMNHFNSNPYVNSHGKPASHPEIYFYPPFIGKCKYVSFSNIYRRILSRYRTYHKNIKKLGPNFAKDEFMAEWNRLLESREIDPTKSFFLKDNAYKHEQEYRFILNAVARNGRDYDECKKDPMFSLVDSHLTAAGYQLAGKNIYLQLSDNFIEKVYLDARCDKWKTNIQASLLRELGLTVEISPAYGSFLSSSAFVPAS